MENIRLQSLQILYTFVLRLPQNGRIHRKFHSGLRAILVAREEIELSLIGFNTIEHLIKANNLQGESPRRRSQRSKQR